jgi:hypothetical protein
MIEFQRLHFHFRVQVLSLIHHRPSYFLAFNVIYCILDEIVESSSFILQQISSLVCNFLTAKHAINSCLLRPIFTLHPNTFHCNVPINDFSIILQIILAACSSLDIFCLLQQTENILGQVKKLKEEFQVKKLFLLSKSFDY